MPSQRVEQALERLAEDETLFAELDDSGARALRGWIERQVAAAADAQAFEQRVRQIRQAARAAARSGASDPVASAQAALARGRATPPTPSRSGAEASTSLPGRPGAYRAAAAHLLAPAADSKPSPAAALLPPAASEPVSLAEQPEQAAPKRSTRAKRRRRGWRYRKVH